MRDALTRVLKLVREEQAPATMALRYVKSSRATLSFTRHAPQTCVMEIDGPRSDLMLGLYEKVWRELEASGIPFTFHWGKMSDVSQNPARVRRMYGDAVDAWRAARETLLPTPDLRRVFSNAYIEGAGLG